MPLRLRTVEFATDHRQETGLIKAVVAQYKYNYRPKQRMNNWRRGRCPKKVLSVGSITFYDLGITSYDESTIFLDNVIFDGVLYSSRQVFHVSF